MPRLMKTLAFTGHRPKDLGGYVENNPTAMKVKKYLKILISHAYESGCRTFITGMAMGVDQWAGEIVANLKLEKPDIKLIAAIPVMNQPSIWPQQTRLQWKQLLAKCDVLHVVDIDEVVTLERILSECDIPSDCPSYVISKKLNERNHWMVNNADCMLAIWKRNKGGTGNCVQYAQSKNKTVIAYNPDDDSVEKI